VGETGGGFETGDGGWEAGFGGRRERAVGGRGWRAGEREFGAERLGPGFLASEAAVFFDIFDYGEGRSMGLPSDEDSSTLVSSRAMGRKGRCTR
jgi:hypothetical protein